MMGGCKDEVNCGFRKENICCGDCDRGSSCSGYCVFIMHLDEKHIKCRHYQSSTPTTKKPDCNTCRWHEARAFRCLIGAGVGCEYESREVVE